jgi:general L-amino acid transport system substrate-binding protein
MQRRSGFHVSYLLVTLVLAGSHPAQSEGTAAQTLKGVRDRGQVVCGVSEGILGFSAPDDRGNWTGLDVDFCRALSAAIFNDASKVRYVPLNTGDRFAALQSNKIDVLSRNSTWTMSRETASGLMFAGVSYYDGQGFLVRKSGLNTSALELAGKKVCVQTGTTTELNLKDFFQQNKMPYEAVTFATANDARTAYDEGRCDVLTSDVSQLYAERLKLAKPDDHLILPDVISKEPLGPLVRQGDDQWLNIVKWTLFALINAEELGVSSNTIDMALKSEKPDIKRLVGTADNFGEQMSLTNDWATRAIRLVGNYAEIYDRNVGVMSKLGIPRGLNQLWTMGGIQYAPPIR